MDGQTDGRMELIALPAFSQKLSVITGMTINVGGLPKLRHRLTEITVTEANTANMFDAQHAQLENHCNIWDSKQIYPCDSQPILG